MDHYHCGDTGYAFTEEEEKQRQQHRQVYADFVKKLREARLQKITQRWGFSSVLRLLAQVRVSN